MSRLENGFVNISEVRANEIMNRFNTKPNPYPKKSYNFPGVLPNGTYIKEVIYYNPATIVFWSDGTKTVCKCHNDDTYSEETGLAMCICKKILGSKEFKHIFQYWLPEQKSLFSMKITLKGVIAKFNKNKR